MMAQGLEIHYIGFDDSINEWSDTADIAHLGSENSQSVTEI